MLPSRVAEFYRDTCWQESCERYWVNPRYDVPADWIDSTGEGALPVPALWPGVDDVAGPALALQRKEGSMTEDRQADAFHYAGKVLDAAEAWHRGDKPATWEALQGVPIAHVVLALLTLTDLALAAVEERTGVPATQMLRAARAEMLKGEHDE